MRRWEIINLLIEKYDLKSYLEIGVFKGDNFNRIRCDLKHSVDPNFPATFEMTSDEFFMINCPQVEMMYYDLIFIDGLHTEEQTYKDLANALFLLAAGGIIVVHDCNPLTEWHTRPPEEYKRGEEWNGTTYKGFIRFVHDHCDGLHTLTIDSDYGVGIIFTQNLGTPKREPITWDYFDQHRTELLNLVSVDKFTHLLSV